MHSVEVDSIGVLHLESSSLLIIVCTALKCVSLTGDSYTATQLIINAIKMLVGTGGQRVRDREGDREGERDRERE